MTTKEKAQELRNKLKEKGYKRNDISIRSGYCGYSSYIDVTIKNPEINRFDIEKIRDDYHLPNDFYGDCYPKEIGYLINKMTLCDNSDDYNYYLNEVEIILEGCAKGYLDWLSSESEE